MSDSDSESDIGFLESEFEGFSGGEPDFASAKNLALIRQYQQAHSLDSSLASPPGFSQVPPPPGFSPLGSTPAVLDAGVASGYCLNVCALSGQLGHPSSVPPAQTTGELSGAMLVGHKQPPVFTSRDSTV